MGPARATTTNGPFHQVTGYHQKYDTVKQQNYKITAVTIHTYVAPDHIVTFIGTFPFW